MTDTYKSITVLVICYKQQDVIKRALDSVLCQKEYGLNKIVVCDDCSPDKTWDVLQDYKSRYPEYFEIHRNEHNLGIYQNMEKLVSLRGESDLFVELSGDDAFENGFFKAVQDFVFKNNISLSDDVGIYGDIKIINPTGIVHFKKQNIIESHKDSLISLWIRHKIEGRSCLVSRSVMDKFKPIVFDKGLNLAESLFDSQKHRLIRKAYYLSKVGNIYFTDIGVSSKLNTLCDYYKQQNIDKWKYFIQNMIINNRKDLYYAYAEISRSKYYISHRLVDFVKASFFFILSSYPNLFPSIVEFKRFVGPMLRNVILNRNKNENIV